MGFERGDSKLKPRRRVLELGTRCKSSEQSDWVNAGRVRAGGRVGWTALVNVLMMIRQVSLSLNTPPVPLFLSCLKSQTFKET